MVNSWCTVRETLRICNIHYNVNILIVYSPVLLYLISCNFILVLYLCSYYILYYVYSYYMSYYDLFYIQRFCYLSWIYGMWNKLQLQLQSTLLIQNAVMFTEKSTINVYLIPSLFHWTNTRMQNMTQYTCMF